MAVVLGSARSDSRGMYSGDQAGDQKQASIPDYKGEVGLENFYNHKLGWVILRAKDPDVAYKIAKAMLQACNNKNIGYDQGQRLGIITYGTNSTVKTECDCSSLVRQCVKEASGVDAGNFTTQNEKSKLLATKLFDEVKFTKQSDLRVGDILVTLKQGHTVVVVDAPNGQNNTPTESVDVFYRAYAGTYNNSNKKYLNGRWYSQVKNDSDYAGLENRPISGVMAKTSKGKIYVRVHPIGYKGEYLEWASGYDVNDYNNGYAGILSTPIDKIQFKLEGLNGKHVKYRVSVVGSTGWLDWVTDLGDYAGLSGKQIDKVQVKIV